MTNSDHTPVSLYVHVPFCVAKCPYCDFYSKPGSSPRLHGPFADAVAARAASLVQARVLEDVPTLYIGGGTPTLLGRELPRLVSSLRETVPLAADAEVTVEANPESLTRTLARDLAQAGVTRVSVGVQSLDDAVLRTLGRCHDRARALSALDAVSDAGLRLSADLMCGIPGQSLLSWSESLRTVVHRRAAHVSVYPLQVEDGTPFAAHVATDELSEPDPDLAAEMMQTAEVILRDAGLVRYETANFARPGEESRHNLGYWTGVPYAGIGPSAAGMLPHGLFARLATAGLLASPQPPAEAARVRFVVERDVSGFIARHERVTDVEYLTAAEAAREDVMLGLRLAAGVDAAAVGAAGLTPVLERLAADGLVESAEGRWRTTRRGWLLGNEVFGRVWNAEV